MNKFTTTKKIVPIDLVVANRWNPNVQSQQMFEKGKQSVEQLGMLGSILVRETGGCYEILDGEHRWRYMKELGYTECPVETMGEIPDQQAQMLTVLINNIHGKDDLEKRAKIFEALDQGQLSLLPFSQEEIENEKALFKFDFAKYADKVKDEDLKEKFRVIIIDVPEDVFKVWQFIKKYGEKDLGKTDLQIFNEMMDHFSAIHFGRRGDETEQTF